MEGERYYVGTDTLYQLVTSVDAWVTNPDIANDYKMALMELCDRIKSERTSPELAVRDSRIAALESQLAERDAEIERLRNYRARMEGAHGDKLYAIEHLLDHFDEEGNLKGDGQWRIRAIWKCCKDFGEGSERAAKLSGESLLSQLAAKDAMLAAATEFEFPNNLRLVQCSDGSWHVWMPGQPGAFKKTLAEAHDAAQAAGWLSQEAKGGTT